ncbi:MAG: S9 family peptidase [Candidatus Brocadiaceae bacterium]|jgi:dipeptidyl aminopeptidase/acylaminoacyl peptidase
MVSGEKAPIPRRVLFGNPDRTSPGLSPDGRRLAFLAPVDDVLNVWVGPADDPGAAEPVTEDRERGIRAYFWSHTNEHILYLQDRDGDENWRVYVTGLESRQTRDLTPLEGVQARVLKVSHRHPERILVGLNDRQPEYHDLHRIDLLSGERELILQNDRFAGFVIDDDYRVRFAYEQTEEGGMRLFRFTEDGTPEEFLEVSREDAMTTHVLGLDAAGTSLFLRDSRGRNTAALAVLDLETLEERVLTEDARADVGDVLRHPTEKHVQAAAFNYTRKEWRPLHPSVEADFERLGDAMEGDLWVASRTLDDRHWLVGEALDTAPARYYAYDRDGGEVRFLFTSHEALEQYTLASMHPVVVTSRDGLDLVNYVTLPGGADHGGRARPEEPLPMVLHVHGGPWGRDTWGFSPVHQWLANRGYAVLSVNFRGSTGFGKAFVNAGDHEWGARMHDDLIDSVNWAVEEGIADPDRVAIMGGSYGGYATLVGLTFTPEVFACGVDLVGPSNLVTLLESVPPYWKPVFEMFAGRVGDPRTEEGRRLLEERSPLGRADAIERPLLIGQGANDPRVRRAESDRIVEAMQEAEIPVTYVLYGDEGHGMARPENRLSFYAVAEAFLAHHLGGRAQPVGDDFVGSSAEIVCGAEQVPGVPAPE